MNFLKLESPLNTKRKRKNNNKLQLKQRMNNWKFKNFEKSNSESHINIFKSLEIENYLKQLLKKTNKKIHTYKLNFSNSTITIFLSIYKENSHRHKNNFLKNMIKSLTKFTNNKFHIILKLKVIKKNLFDKIKNKFLLNIVTRS